VLDGIVGSWNLHYQTFIWEPLFSDIHRGHSSGSLHQKTFFGRSFVGGPSPASIHQETFSSRTFVGGPSLDRPWSGDLIQPGLHHQNFSGQPSSRDLVCPSLHRRTFSSHPSLEKKAFSDLWATFIIVAPMLQPSKSFRICQTFFIMLKISVSSLLRLNK